MLEIARSSTRRHADLEYAQKRAPIFPTYSRLEYSPRAPPSSAAACAATHQARDLGVRLAEERLTELALRLPHVAELSSLPNLHRDAFDRLLSAQARVEQLTLVTADEHLQSYPVKSLSAR